MYKPLWARYLIVPKVARTHSTTVKIVLDDENAASMIKISITQQELQDAVLQAQSLKRLQKIAQKC